MAEGHGVGARRHPRSGRFGSRAAAQRGGAAHRGGGHHRCRARLAGRAAIQVGPPGALPSNSFVRLRGLPASVSLTEGHAIAPGSWAIPLFGCRRSRPSCRPGVSGRTEIIIQLVGVDGTMLAEGRTALVVGPGRHDGGGAG